MTRQKWFLLITAVAFVGWLAYLGYAMAVHRLNPPDIVSRSQLTEASYVVVVEVTLDGGAPSETVKVKQRLDGTGPESGEIVVKNLPKATTSADQPLPGSGEYLLFLTADGVADPRVGPYKIAGWPRGLGESSVQPGVELKQTVEEVDADGKTQVVQKPYNPPRYVRPPVAYPWTEAVKKQMRGLGYSL